MVSCRVEVRRRRAANLERCDPRTTIRLERARAAPRRNTGRSRHRMVGVGCARRRGGRCRRSPRSLAPFRRGSRRGVRTPGGRRTRLSASPVSPYRRGTRDGRRRSRSGEPRGPQADLVTAVPPRGGDRAPLGRRPTPSTFWASTRRRTRRRRNSMSSTTSTRTSICPRWSSAVTRCAPCAMSFSARSALPIREHHGSWRSTRSTRRGRRTGGTPGLRIALVPRCGSAIRRHGGSGTAG